MPLDSLIPWSVPVLAGNARHIGGNAPADSTTTAVNTNVADGPPLVVRDPAPRPRVGRSNRGDRAQVKAARRARRSAR